MQKFDKITLISQFQDYDFGRGLYLLAHADSDTLGRGTLLIGSEGEDDGFYPDEGADVEIIFELVSIFEQFPDRPDITGREVFSGIVNLPVGTTFCSEVDLYRQVGEAIDSLPLSP